MAPRQLLPHAQTDKPKSDRRKAYPPAEELRKILSYNPCTGRLVWLRRAEIDWRDVRHNRHWVGREAGSVNPRTGYRYIGIRHARNGLFSAHRLAWIWWYGENPELEIDHRNRIRDDNCITNLKLVDLSGQARNKGQYKNNKSGIRGVCWHANTGKWVAQITRNGTVHRLGHFDDKVEAGEAYKRAAAKEWKT